MPSQVLVVVNATGRQAASAARVAAAVGYDVRAHVNSKDNLVAVELGALENVTVVEGSLDDHELIENLFAGAHRAFINTISWGDEVAIGKALADAAKKARVQHYIYSSMPDHSVYGRGWPGLPLWRVKFTVENYIRQARLLFPYEESPGYAGER
jgi:nucleoside-diphosphate-sugar epimerase